MRQCASGTGFPTLVYVAGLLTLTQAPAMGQPASSVLDPGARVRVTHANSVRITGLYLGGTTDSLWVARAGGTGLDTLAFARDAITRLERSVGWRSNVGQGAKVGALVGVGAGAVLGAVAGAASQGDFIEINPVAGALAGAFVLGATGTVLGLIAGGLSHREVFADIPAAENEGIMVFSSAGPVVAVGLSIPFGRTRRATR